MELLLQPRFVLEVQLPVLLVRELKLVALIRANLQVRRIAFSSSMPSYRLKCLSYILTAIMVVSTFLENWEKRIAFRLLSGYTGMYYPASNFSLINLSVPKGWVHRRQCELFQRWWFDPWGWWGRRGCCDPVSPRIVRVSGRGEDQNWWSSECWFVWVGSIKEERMVI